MRNEAEKVQNAEMDLCRDPVRLPGCLLETDYQFVQLVIGLAGQGKIILGKPFFRLGGGEE
jgi:hypothetical protein